MLVCVRACVRPYVYNYVCACVEGERVGKSVLFKFNSQHTPDRACVCVKTTHTAYAATRSVITVRHCHSYGNYIAFCGAYKYLHVISEATAATTRHRSVTVVITEVKRK